MQYRNAPINGLRPLKVFNRDDPQILLLRSRIAKLGFLSPAVVSRSGLILDGNKRYAAMAMQETAIPVVEVDVEESEAWAVHCALNASLTPFIGTGSHDALLDPYLAQVRKMLDRGASASVLNEIEEVPSVGGALHSIIDEEFGDLGSGLDFEE